MPRRRLRKLSIAIRPILSQFPARVKEHDAGVAGRRRGTFRPSYACPAGEQSLALDALFW